MTLANNKNALYHGMPDFTINAKIPGVILSSTDTRESTTTVAVVKVTKEAKLN